MKELYLIPKHQFELMKSKSSSSSKSSTNSTTNSITTSTNGTNPTTDSNKTKIVRPSKITRPKFNNRNKPKIPKIGQEWGTRVLPPILQNSIPLKGISFNHDQNKKNPNIQAQLSMKFYGTHLSHARVLLNHLEKSGLVDWDEYGDIFKPFNGYNVIDFIEDVISTWKIDISKLEDYWMIINSTNLPLHFIKNPVLKNYINQKINPTTAITTTTTRSSRGKKTNKGKLIPSKSKPRWDIY